MIRKVILYLRVMFVSLTDTTSGDLQWTVVVTPNYRKQLTYLLPDSFQTYLDY